MSSPKHASKYLGRKRDPATAAVVKERSLALQKAGRLLQHTFLPPIDPPTSVLSNHCMNMIWIPGISEQGSSVLFWDWAGYYLGPSRVLDGVLESVNTRCLKDRNGMMHRIDMALVRLPDGILKAFPTRHVFLAGRVQDGRCIRLTKKAKVRRPLCTVTSLLRQGSPLPGYVIDGFPVDEWGNRGRGRGRDKRALSEYVLDGFRFNE